MPPEQFSFEDDSGSIFEEENKHLEDTEDDLDDDLDADDDLGSERDDILENRVAAIEPKQELYLDELQKIDDLYQKIEQDIQTLAT